LLLRLGEDRVGDRERLLGRQLAIRRRVHDLAVDPELRPLARGDVKVARAAPDHLLQQAAQIDRLARCRRGHRRRGTHDAADALMTSSSAVSSRATYLIPAMRTEGLR